MKLSIPILREMDSQIKHFTSYNQAEKFKKEKSFNSIDIAEDVSSLGSSLPRGNTLLKMERMMGLNLE